MDKQALLAALREMLDDQTKPYLWEDETLVRKLNNAVREACIRARLLKDDEVSCPALCQLPVIAGQPYVKYAPEVLVVRNGRLAAGTCEKLWALTAESMDRYRPDWQWSTQQACEPEVMVMDLAQKTLRLFPTPAANDTLYLRAWRVPRQSEWMSCDSNRKPIIQLPNAEDLCHYAAYEAYMIHDTEMEDPAAAKTHLEIFEERFGTRPSLHEMARWADSPPRIRTAVMF